MGIPSYFSYIIKNYPNIIRKFKHCEPFQHLFMDCNSIVYDAFYDIEKKYKREPFDLSNIETIILNKVSENIHNYIKLISPKKTIFITFDGVAPFAKMDQQRVRRYKSAFMTDITGNSKSSKIWNTTSITPGTSFMKKLSAHMTQTFMNTEKKYGVNKIMVSCADEKGEGEHKLFQYIREHDVKNDIFAVYGLDSELIMLSIFHRSFCQNIFVFREAPEFKSVISQDKIKDPCEKLFMDIDKLSSCIFSEMGSGSNHSSIRAYDYIFLCFFLGNDFLPHFPALNIRTNGTQILIDTYQNFIRKPENNSFLSPTNKKIQWKFVSLFLKEIAKNEHQYILNEYCIRDKWDTRKWAVNTTEEKELLLENIPVIYRCSEKYICPTEIGWEKRYYQILFDIDPTEENIKRICINYIQGLEWVMKYYTVGCPDWRWKYNYHYPPLISDLQKYIPLFETDFFEEKNKENVPFTEMGQLAYVLPREHLYLLGDKKDILLEKYGDEYPTEYGFEWAFCRYFWEAHPKLPIASDKSF